MGGEKRGREREGREEGSLRGEVREGYVGGRKALEFLRSWRRVWMVE